MRNAVSIIFLCGVVGCAATPVPTEMQIIDSFESCVQAGGKILRTLPARCVTKEGFIFAAPFEGGCENHCGNGVCEEIVCQAVGCPCAETPHTCPADCAEKESP